MSMRPNIAQDRFWPGSKVVVVGAGISGVTAAAHLLKQGLLVTVFERSSISGGVWHFDNRTPEDPSYPSNTPSVGDYERSRPGQYAYSTPPPETADEMRGEPAKSPSATDDALAIHFSPPGPCYAGLKNNVPTSLMVSALGPWLEGTQDITGQQNLERDIQMLASNHGVNRVTHYNTRVDEIRKSQDRRRWLVRTVALERRHGVPRLVERHHEFDSVVIASGHYNLQRIPDTQGLKEWKAAFAGRVMHSKQYRKAEHYRGKTVLLVGAGVSSVDICRELGSVASRIYQSARGGVFDLPKSMIPETAERVAEVSSYVTDATYIQGQPLAADDPIPSRILLADGRILAGIDYVIITTGYITSYPFLQQLHADNASAAEAGPELLVGAEGEMAHNLHKDIFYIPDPTLAFVGVPYHIATFSLFDFQSQIVGRVFAGKAILPPEDQMRAEYQKRLTDRGVGRSFHSLREDGQEVAYVKALVDWANDDAERLGADPMEGDTQAWLEGYVLMKERMKKLLGVDI